MAAGQRAGASARPTAWWLVTRYDDIREMSREPARFSSRHGALVNDPLRAVEPNDEPGSLLHLDPPLHADYRKLLNREFTPRAGRAHGGDGPRHRDRRVRRTRRVPADRSSTWSSAWRCRYPCAVIAELLGMGERDRWPTSAAGPTRRSRSPTTRADEVVAAAMEFFAFLDDHVRQRFESPGDDLLSLLATSQVGDVPLTQAQVRLFCMTLMVAGQRDHAQPDLRWGAGAG